MNKSDSTKGWHTLGMKPMRLLEKNFPFVLARALSRLDGHTEKGWMGTVAKRTAFDLSE